MRVAGALKQATAPTVSLTRYEQSVPQIAWAGTWSTSANAAPLRRELGLREQRGLLG